MKSILDPSFRYVSSHSTDLRKTFARIKREMRKSDAPPEPRDPTSKIVTLRTERKRA